MQHVRGLDGLRAVAVVVVLLFHAEVPSAGGGFLGVSLFFTLSGFLITTLLLTEHEESGTISFRRFYGRRARRLLPAAYLCLLLVAAWSTWWAVEQRRSLTGDLIAAVANVANWRFALSSTSYQDLFVSQPSPVAHFWSLAIEEQIYLVLPIVVLLAVRRGRTTLAATTAALLAASVLATLVTGDRDLVYNGTHTRAAELLVGVVLAQVMFRRRTVERTRRRGDWVPGAAALVAFGGLVVATSLEQEWIYRGGLVVVALVSAVLINAVTAGRFPARLLETGPLVAVGAVSYGIYLFHWPVFLLLDKERTGLDGPLLFGIRLAATGVLTVVSSRLLEQPIRRGRIGARDRMMVPALALAALVVVAAAITVRGPGLTPTQQLLSIGEQSVVEFAPPGTIADGVAWSTASDPPSTTIEPSPQRVLVMGTEPSAIEALSAAGFDVIDGLRPECPLALPAANSCGPFIDRFRLLTRQHRPSALVVAVGPADEAAAVAQGEVVGAEWKAGEQEVVAALDVATQIQMPVALYYPAAEPGAFDPHLDRLLLMRPWLGEVNRTGEALDATVSSVLAARGGDSTRPSTERDGEPLRVLVIGDSTSINMAKALNDGGDGRLSVLWAGANGCPLVPVDGFRASSDVEWSSPDCVAYEEKLPPLIDRFGPDVVLLAVGPTELAEQRYDGDPSPHVAGDPVFAAARDAAMERLLAVLGPDLPLLVADVPAITAGFFATTEMTDPNRLASVNEQVVRWDTQWPQVERFNYREPLEATEQAVGSMRSDGVHPDPAPFEDLARTVLVDELIEQTAAVRSALASSR